MRAYDLTALSTSGQDFKANSLWDAGANVPAPGNRTLYTALAGSANLGWKKINWDYTQTDPATCAVPSGFVDDTGRPICDLSMKLAQCSAAGVTVQQIRAGDPTGSKASTLGAFVQAVRGWCAAHDKTSGAVIMQPTDAQCDSFNSKWQRNTPFLGGVDHSSPAIVGPSPYLGDATASDGTALPWSTRPVVAYFGARDGMLHAVYVSGAPWSAQGASLAAGTRPGTELWAFLPPGQICGLAANEAKVDANVSVMDVFGNFPRDVNGDGVFDLTNAQERPSGIREWRTILVATAGEGAAEVFAMDVTNPLKPILLWHVGGAENSDDRFDMNDDGDFADSGDHMNKAQPRSYAYKWYNSDDGTQGSHAWIPTNYGTTDSTVLDGIKSGRYDYRNLGYAYGTATGTIWNGNAFRWVTYVTTSAADFSTSTPTGYKGVEVFAVDVVTGQKLWQWENRYTRERTSGGVMADNGIPGRAALVDVDADGSVDRVYVGDLEGHMWELGALDGKNLNYLKNSAGALKSYPLFGTPAMSSSGVEQSIIDAYTASDGMAQQPLTSPIGVGRFTQVPTALQPYLQNRIAVAQGTMGVDWSIAPTQAGHVYVVPAYPATETRLTEPVSTAANPDPLLYGLVLPAASWDTALDVGERVYGMPKIVNNTMFVNTSYGTFTGDISGTLSDVGRSLQVTASGRTTVDTGQKRFGGVLIFGTELVITSDVGIIRKANAAPSTTVETRVRDRFTPTAPKSWEQRPDGAPPFVQ
jgi:type IV pilus assembly protein PilY1